MIKQFSIFTISTIIAIGSLGLSSSVSGATSDEVPPNQKGVQAMEWRFIGPVMGGRGTSVELDPVDDQTFYFGSASGGLWKSEDAGQYWENITDGQLNVGSIGAVAIAPSNPQVMYIGTGEPQLRHDVSYGDGMYKSGDGGKTWQHIGLENTYHISRVRVHPTNPDIVYVGALGSAFGYNEDRGVYKTVDGGKTWDKVFFKSDKAGVIDLVMDPNNPEVLYAAAFQFIRKDWTVESGGPDSSLWKTEDGGKNWAEISKNNGFPQGILGRMGLAVSKANSNIIYSLTDTESEDGIYRSDDGGDNWKLVSDDPNLTVRPFYFNHLYASPVDADELWVLTNKLWQSVDGGVTWKQRSGTKDDFHDMLIDEKNPRRMIVTHDGGTMVSMNAGKTWSSPYTQRTTQTYRVHTDNQFPYNVYTNIQDLIGYKVPSASFWGGIPLSETTPFGSSEAGYAVPHPTDPNIIYQFNAVSMSGFGGFTRTNLATGAFEERSVYSNWAFGTPTSDFKYRFGWNSPVATSVFNPDAVYFAGNYLFKSLDQGMHWERISPDLTTNSRDKQIVPGGDLAVETSGAEISTVVIRMAVSRLNEGTIWTASDDGMVYLTRDDGKNWEDVTPRKLKKDSKIVEIIESPHDAATAYIAVTRLKGDNDRRPYLFKTSNSGKDWQNISDAFPQDQITRTIWEDSVRKGLLFVGTETGIYYSLNDGASWQRLENGFPRVPVYHIIQKDEDLVVASHGRGLWVLDDVTPLRVMTDGATANNLIKPRDTYRFGKTWWKLYGGGVFEGQKNYFVQNHRPGHTFIEQGVVNGERRRKFLDAGDAKPDGVIIYYTLVAGAQDVSLTILDDAGKEIVSFSGDAISHDEGLNRFVWNMMYPNALAIPGKPRPGIMPVAKPGTYTAQLSADGVTHAQQFQVFMNPNETYSQADADAKFALWIEIRDKYSEVSRAIIQAMEVSDEVTTKATELDSREAKNLAENIVVAAKELEGNMTAVGTTLVQIANERSKLLAKIQAVTDMLYSTEGGIPQGASDAYRDYGAAIDAELAKWNEVMVTDVAKFRELTSFETVSN